MGQRLVRPVHPNQNRPREPMARHAAAGCGARRPGLGTTDVRRRPDVAGEQDAAPDGGLPRQASAAGSRTHRRRCHRPEERFEEQRRRPGPVPPRPAVRRRDPSRHVPDHRGVPGGDGHVAAHRWCGLPRGDRHPRESGLRTNRRLRSDHPLRADWERAPRSWGTEGLHRRAPTTGASLGVVGRFWRRRAARRWADPRPCPALPPAESLRPAGRHRGVRGPRTVRRPVARRGGRRRLGGWRLDGRMSHGRMSHGRRPDDPGS